MKNLPPIPKGWRLIRDGEVIKFPYRFLFDKKEWKIPDKYLYLNSIQGEDSNLKRITLNNKLSELKRIKNKKCPPLGKVINSKFYYSIIERKLAILYQNQEKIYTLLKEINNKLNEK